MYGTIVSEAAKGAGYRLPYFLTENTLINILHIVQIQKNQIHSQYCQCPLEHQQCVNPPLKIDPNKGTIYPRLSNIC